jgi:RNA polymerase sigma-70 factor (ECF subfamily)
MRFDAETRASILREIPHLRAFAILLCGDVDHADDLVHATLVRAASVHAPHIDALQPESDLRARLFKILRHANHCACRRSKRANVRRNYLDGCADVPEQAGADTAGDLHEALGRLSPHHREAIVLVAGGSLSYEEAAAVADCDVEAIKTQVREAVVRLALFMSDDTAWRPRTAVS